MAQTAAGPTLVVDISGRFTDPGFNRPSAPTFETFMTTIDWGDGTVEPVTNLVTQGSEGVLTMGTFLGRHAYAAAGIYTATVTLADDDGGHASQQFR